MRTIRISFVLCFVFFALAIMFVSDRAYRTGEANGARRGIMQYKSTCEHLSNPINTNDEWLECEL